MERERYRNHSNWGHEAESRAARLWFCRVAEVDNLEHAVSILQSVQGREWTMDFLFAIYNYQMTWCQVK